VEAHDAAARVDGDLALAGACFLRGEAGQVQQGRSAHRLCAAQPPVWSMS
jgi:hypothetical protein